MTQIGKLLGVLALILAGTQSQAALINYDDRTDGDLPGINSTPASFFLDTVGLNVWRGSSATPTGTSSAELDYFTVSLAAGLRIDSYSMSISNFQDLPGSDDIFVSAFTLIRALDRIERYATYNLVEGGTPTETNPVPLPWTDPLSVTTNYGRGDQTRYSWDWEVTLTTSRSPDGVIPLPAGLPLLGGGLLLLAGLTRRKQHSD